MPAVETTKGIINPAGVYRHPGSGKELIAVQHPKFGSAMADGFVATGYKYVGPAPTKTEQLKAEAKASTKDKE